MKEYLLGFLDFASDLFFAVKDGKICYVNKTAQSLLGQNEAEIIGQSMINFLVSHDLEKWQKSFENFNNSSETKIDFKVRIVQKDQKVRMINWTLKSVSEDLILVKGEDITEELKQKDRFQQYSLLLTNVNESLERSSHRLFMLQNVVTSMIPYDPNSISKLLDVGVSVFEMKMGYVAIFDNETNNLLIENTDPKHTNFIGAIVDSSEMVNAHEKEALSSLKTKISEQEIEHNGASFTYKSFLAFPLFRRGKIVGMIKFLGTKSLANSNFDNNEFQFLSILSDTIGRVIELNDINDQLKLHSDELEQKNKELDEFAYIVSHDLKAPLRAIGNLASFIAEDIDDPNCIDEVKENVGLMNQRVKRMENLISGVLKYSRVGRENVDKVQFSTADIIYSVIGDLKTMNSKAIIEFEGNSPQIENIEIYFEQIISNLLSNAIKYNDKEIPKIKISCIDKFDSLEFSIDDNGPGIPDEFKEKVFEVFQTLNPRDEVEGTGIGLTIVLKMLKLMGGEITLKDSVLGGAKFTFTVSKNL